MRVYMRLQNVLPRILEQITNCKDAIAQKPSTLPAYWNRSSSEVAQRSANRTRDSSKLSISGSLILGLL